MIHLRSYSIVVLLILGLFLQTGTCSGGGQRQPEPMKLKVLLLPYLSFAPLFIAEEEGYFAEQGLEIEFVKMTSSAPAIVALARGELDVVAAILSVGLLNAMARGAKIKFVADKGYIAFAGCTSNALVATRALVEGSELQTPAQLQGRRIALKPASFSGYFVEKLLRSAGLSLDDVEAVNIPTPAQPEALEKGAIDVTVTQEPWLTRILRGGHAVIWMPAQQVIPDFQLGMILYGPTLLDENPEAGRRFMVAYFEAVQRYNQGKTDRNVEILAKYTRLDQELLRQACWVPMREDGQINLQSVLDFQVWALKKGFIDRTVTEDEFWDPSFVEHANQVLGRSP